MLLRIACKQFRPVAALKPKVYYSTITMSKTEHAERTAAEPRDPSLHKVILARVEEINPTIRTFRLNIPSPATGIKFLPGQWLDVYVPDIENPGGFTITSPPSKAFKSTSAAGGQPSSSTNADHENPPNPYLELAVQKSPDNIVAKWLWQPVPSILSSEIQVRVGGSFVWPPPGIVPTGRKKEQTLKKIIFIAGGVGINPLMSILSHLAEKPAAAQTIHFLYSMRDPGEGQRDPHKILFLDRLASIFDGKGIKGELKLFITSGSGSGSGSGGGGGGDRAASDETEKLDRINIPFSHRRIAINDIAEIVGADKRSAVVYLCGVPTMTDQFVEQLTSPNGLGLEPHRVLCEKWW